VEENMADFEDQKKKITSILKEYDASQKQAEAAKKPRKASPRKPPMLSIVGHNNIQAAGDIHVTSPKVVNKVIVQTGVGTVTASQKAELTRLKEEWREVHNSIKRSELSHGAAWGAFNKHFKINSYSELEQERFEDGCAWFKRQIAILRKMPSAKCKDQDWRRSRITYIKAVCKNDLGSERAYVPYIQERFGKSSLKYLLDSELDATHGYVAGLKSRMKKTL
jgi:hypothetical protein